MSQRRQRSQVNDAQRANLIKPEPRSEKQAHYIASIFENEQTFVFGPAGTGKTYIAAAMAAFLYLRREVDGIIITRPKVEDEEEWGHLPGSLLQKTAPWTAPVMEILIECFGSKMVVEEMLKSGEIEVLPLGYMRGRTLHNKFVILDEAQNTTRKQMRMFNTRLGAGAKVVVNGDLQQKDIRPGSGLGEALRMVTTYEVPAGIVEFTREDVQRSALCGAWVEAYEDHDYYAMAAE